MIFGCRYSYTYYLFSDFRTPTESIYIYISIYLRFSIFCSHFSYVYWYLCKMIYYMIGLLYWWIWVESKPKLSDFCSILFRYVFLFSSTTWCNISSVLWTRSGVFVVIVICLILLYSVKMHRFAVIGWSETEFCFIFGTCSIVDKRKSWKCRWNKYYLYIYLWFTQQDKKPNKTELGIVCFERLYVMTHTASLNSQWTVRRIEKSKTSRRNGRFDIFLVCWFIIKLLLHSIKFIYFDAFNFVHSFAINIYIITCRFC